MMQYIYPVNAKAESDHCAECGGEEFEGGCGRLHPYLVIAVDREGFAEYEEKTVCDGCADGIESLKTLKGQL